VEGQRGRPIRGGPGDALVIDVSLGKGNWEGVRLWKHGVGSA